MVFRTHYRPLCQFAFSFLKDKDSAEEAVQTCFAHLWEKRAELTVEVSLRAYLFRSVRNHCLNRLKHEKVKREHRKHSERYQLHSADDVTDTVHATELHRRIREAVERLPEQCRAVFMKSRWEEKKYQEIADEMGISVKTVENHMGKALRTLRDELAEFLPLIVFYMLSNSLAT